MTKPSPLKERPRSPHFTIYKWPITMWMSLSHRLTGVALYFGTLFVTIWLFALAAGGNYFECVNYIYNSIFGKIILFGYSFALLQHMFGGIRHLVWDICPASLEKHLANKAALLTISASLFSTLILWLTFYIIK
ncbi:succinate dehydrogenase, cytochrome b556 subunit [Bartonella sp. DGB1]|uniref:succinate dehydrogenase, cytochrome b556 subunit n=1 Tax=Bartonella sp. DGB1 TaxID=3239807 RepID=UPI003524600F